LNKNFTLDCRQYSGEKSIQSVISNNTKETGAIQKINGACFLFVMDSNINKIPLKQGKIPLIYFFKGAAWLFSSNQRILRFLGKIRDKTWKIEVTK